MNDEKIKRGDKAMIRQHTDMSKMFSINQD